MFICTKIFILKKSFNIRRAERNEATMRMYRCRKGQRRCAIDQSEIDEYTMRGRPMKEVLIDEYPKITELTPKPVLSEEVVTLTVAEYEAMRLIDLLGLNQYQAGQLMNVSRGTIWRMLDSGRGKLMRVLTEGLKLKLEEQKKI